MKLDEAVKNIMRQMTRRIDGLGERLASDTARSWIEKNRVVYCSVTSDGTSGRKWIGRLEKAGVKVEDEAKYTLRSQYFKPTSGIKTDIAVLKGILVSERQIAGMFK